MIKNLMFDLDDTILNCSCHYDDCKKEFALKASARTETDYDEVLRILNAIDGITAKLHTFTKERFPLSFAATSAVLDALGGDKTDDEAAREAYDMGNKVFDCDYPLIPGAYEALSTYHNRGFNLILYTKGDPAIQKRKIKKNGLEAFFSPFNTFIVPVKNGDVVKDIIKKQYILPVETVLIGDNFKEDIQSAIDAGLQAIWITPTTTPGYVDEGNAFSNIHSIADLPLIIPQVSPFANHN
jgi:putative hydrolase of the HAD superfamily